MIQTVLGGVEASKLTGPILPHEHVLVDFSRGHVAPPTNLQWLTEAKLTMGNLGKIRRYPCSVKRNLVMDVEEMQGELELFKSAGGATICELSCTGVRCSPQQASSLAQLSRLTGVNIVHATGFYCHRFLDDAVHRMSVEEMTDAMLEEVCVGVGGSGVRCGVVYLGCSWPLHPTEERALRAAAAVQKAEGTPITVHPGRHEDSSFQILDILQSAGADTSRVCITHNDRTFPRQPSQLLELASRNCYLNVSLFGKECSHYQYDSGTDMPSDAQRIEMVKLVLRGGHRDKILISHDVVCRHELRRYGGHGYGHLLEHVVPKMRERGIDDETVTSITTDNPRRWLTPLPKSYIGESRLAQNTG